MPSKREFVLAPSGLFLPAPAEASRSLPRDASVVAVFMDHEDIFPDEPSGFAEFKRLVSSLSRTDALLWAARLNVLVGGPLADPLETQLLCVKALFPSDTFERVAAFRRKRGPDTRVFFRAQLLELMKWIVLLAGDDSDDGSTFERPEVRRTFARACLLASDVWQKRVYGNHLHGDETLSEKRRSALAAVRRSNSESSPASGHPLLALARGYDLFGKRMRDKVPEVGDLFRESVGLSIEDYYSVAAYVAVQTLVPATNAPTEALTGPQICGLFYPEHYEGAEVFGPLAKEFFSREGQTADDLRTRIWDERTDAAEADDAVPILGVIRDRPILLASGGRAIVLDPPTFVDRLSAGPLFHLLAAGQRPANEWFQVFGEVFEEYCGDLFDRVYPPSPNLVRRFTRNPTGTGAGRSPVELADGLLTDGRDVALIEMKAVWIPERAFSPDQDASEYLKELRRKYGSSVQGGQHRVKGVAQLARSIRNLADGTWVPDCPELLGPVRVIPVLLVHDALLDAPGHSYVLAQEFARELRATRNYEDDWTEMHAGQYRVAHLVVLTVDDLEILENSARHFALMDCLRDYCERCADRVLSFHNYLAVSRYRTTLYSNGWLGGEALELLDRVKSILPMEVESTCPQDDAEQP